MRTGWVTDFNLRVYIHGEEMKRVKKREQRGGLHLLLTDDSQKIRHFLEIKLKVYVAEVLLIISHCMKSLIQRTVFYQCNKTKVRIN